MATEVGAGVNLDRMTPGDTFVFGKDRDTARALLQAADDLGHSPLVVRTVRGGFVVPSDVWDRVAAAQAGSSGAAPDVDF